MIRDKILDSTGLKEIEDAIKTIPWYINPNKVRKGDNNECFCNLAYSGHRPTSEVFDLISLYFSMPLDVVAWWRIRLCITWKEPTKRLYGYHTDYDHDPNYEKYKHMKTALYYLSDTNGPTIFEKTGKEVECVKNRLLVFPAYERHSGITHTEGDNKRIVINFNYF